MCVDQIFSAKLMPEYFVPLLTNRDGKNFRLVGPVGIADPDPVLRGARNLEVLIDFAYGFISTCRRGIPGFFRSKFPPATRRSCRRLERRQGKYRRQPASYP